MSAPLASSSAPLSRFRIALVLPVVIGVFLVGDLVARGLPIDGLCFQAWECVTRFQAPGSIFEANRQFRSARTHGNMSNMGNLPAEQVVRPQVFTTDRFGFRNDPTLASADVRAVMVGDSFVAGYGISDEETLPVQLSALAGVPIYNAGGPYAYAGTVKTMRGRLAHPAPEAIIVWSESEPIDQLRAAEAFALRPNWQARALTAALGDTGVRVREVLRGWWFTSPLKIVAQKAFLRVSNDRILPNVYAKLVDRQYLQNGDSMLFLPSDVEPFHQHRDVEPAREYIRGLTATMAKVGVRAHVVLVPHKYSVYYPLLGGTPPLPGDVVHPLSQLATALRADGVDVLDLTPLLRTKAREAATQKQYVYWRDDTHWDGAGVAVAAAAIRDAWFHGSGAGR